MCRHWYLNVAEDKIGVVGLGENEFHAMQQTSARNTRLVLWFYRFSVLEYAVGSIIMHEINEGVDKQELTWNWNVPKRKHKLLLHCINKHKDCSKLRTYPPISTYTLLSLLFLLILQDTYIYLSTHFFFPSYPLIISITKPKACLHYSLCTTKI